MNTELQQRVLEDGEEVITCRPADLISPEIEKLTEEFEALAQEKGIDVAENEIDDVLIYALFPQVGLKFLQNRDNPDAFEPAPGTEPEAAPVPAASAAPAAGDPESYHVVVNGTGYDVTVSAGGAVSSVTPAAAPAAALAAPAPTASGGTAVDAPLAGNIFKINVTEGQSVAAGDVIMILEAMKMETEVRAPSGGTVASIAVKEGDAVHTGDALLTLA
jgi:oxaloacetate decarboxylase alpha subunit